MERLIIDLGEGQQEASPQIFQQFLDRSPKSTIPVNFHKAFKKVLARPRPVTASEDDAIVKTANLLFDFNFKNTHEASFMLHYASTVSLMKTANSTEDPGEKDRVLSEAKQEFGRMSFCASLAKEAGGGPPRGKYSLFIKLARVVGRISTLKRFDILMNSAERYFSDPQIRARMTLLAHQEH